MRKINIENNGRLDLQKTRDPMVLVDHIGHVCPRVQTNHSKNKSTKKVQNISDEEDWNPFEESIHDWTKDLLSEYISKKHTKYPKLSAVVKIGEKPQYGNPKICCEFENKKEKRSFWMNITLMLNTTVYSSRILDALKEKKQDQIENITVKNKE
jgi:hypothetical protein